MESNISKSCSNNYATNENTNPRTSIIDSNALYKQLIESSIRKPIRCIHPKIFGDINNQLNSFSNERQQLIEKENNSESLLTNYKQLEQNISHISNKRIRLRRQHNDFFNLSKQHNSLTEPSQLHKENKRLKNEIEELNLKNSKLKESIVIIKERLCEILSLGVKEYVYLLENSFNKNTYEDLLEQVHRLVGYLLVEKKALVDKCEKLTEIGTHLLKIKEQNVMKIADENKVMKEDLKLICAKKL